METSVFIQTNDPQNLNRGKKLFITFLLKSEYLEEF